MDKLTVASLLAILAVSTIPVTAQEGLPNPGITPDNWLYGLDRAIERLQLVFASTDDKARIRFEQAQERLSEAKVMADKGKHDLAKRMIEDYVEALNESMRFGEEIANLAKKREFESLIARATQIHLDVLSEVYEKVPEQAKEAIQRAMEQSIRGHQKALEVLNKTGGIPTFIPKEIQLPEVVPEEVKSRLEKIGEIKPSLEIREEITTKPGREEVVQSKIEQPTKEIPQPTKTPGVPG